MTCGSGRVSLWSMGPFSAPEILGKVQLFEPLSPDQLERLSAGATRVEVPAGRPVFLEGQEGGSLFVLIEGLVRIVRANDPSTTLTTIKPGVAFGELAVLNSAPRSASAIAIDASELLEISKDAVDAILDDDPLLARKMLGALAASLTVAREAVVQQNRVLDDKVRSRTAELRETQLEVIRRLGRAAEFRDDDTGLHITRMSRFCARLAEAAGMEEADVELLLQAAPMHDIGKIGIPDGILLKPGKLDPDEFELMKTHTTIGAELLSGSNSALMQLAQEIALNHHEKWNGRGYPRGLSGEDIPFVSRIVSICDVFDALTSSRPYKEAWPAQEAFDFVTEQAGVSFDPHLVELFIGIGSDIRAMMDDTESLLAWVPGGQVGDNPM